MGIVHPRSTYKQTNYNLEMIVNKTGYSHGYMFSEGVIPTWEIIIIIINLLLIATLTRTVVTKMNIKQIKLQYARSFS